MSVPQLEIQATSGPDGLAVVVALLGTEAVYRDSIDLRKAADVERFAVALSGKVPAVAPEAIEAELRAIDPAGLPAVPGADGSWDDPRPIELPDVPTFPVEVLPESLRAWVTATAEATQTPPDLAGLLALANCAAAVARRVEVVAGRGWREPLCLYAAVLLDPGNRKSEVFKAAARPLKAIEAELIEEAKPRIARLASDRRILEKRQAKAEKAAGEKYDPEAAEEAARLAEELAMLPVPVLPELIVTEASPEAVEMALAAQGGRLAVMSAEGGVFDLLGGRYSGGAPNLDAFLMGHSGDDLAVKRMSREAFVKRPALTCAFAVQPAVVRGLSSKPAFRGRGLLGRFWYAVPESPLGRRKVDPEPVPDTVAAEYENLIRRLASIEQDQKGPELVRLSPEAAAQFVAWRAEVETWLADGGRLESMTDWGGKLCGLAARLAALLHLASNPNPEPWRDPIESRTIEGAIRLAEYAIEHARAALSMLRDTEGEPLEDARYLLRWLRRKGLREFSRRDAQNHGRRRFDGDPERLDAALQILADRSWIRLGESGAKNGPGRNPSPRFDVNPATWPGAGNRLTLELPAGFAVENGQFSGVL